MGWQLIEELFNSVFLSRAVDVRDLLFRQAGEIQLDLPRRKQRSDRGTHVTHALQVSFSSRFTSGPIYEGKRLRYIRAVTVFVLKIRDPDEPAQQTWIVSDKTSTQLLNCFSGMQFAVTIKGGIINYAHLMFSLFPPPSGLVNSPVEIPSFPLQFTTQGMKLSRKQPLYKQI